VGRAAGNVENQPSSQADPIGQPTVRGRNPKDLAAGQKRPKIGRRNQDVGGHLPGQQSEEQPGGGNAAPMIQGVHPDVGVQGRTRRDLVLADEGMEFDAVFLTRPRGNVRHQVAAVASQAGKGVHQNPNAARHKEFLRVKVIEKDTLPGSSAITAHVRCFYMFSHIGNRYNGTGFRP
jgi:hypothetical protein